MDGSGCPRIFSALDSAYNPIDNLNVNGAFTLGENIGDLGGLTIAYRAYQLSLKGKRAPVIEGLTGPPAVFSRLGTGLAQKVS